VGHSAALDASSRNWLPFWLGAPIDVWAVAALVGATITSAYKKFPSGDVKPVIRNFPIFLIYLCRHAVLSLVTQAVCVFF